MVAIRHMGIYVNDICKLEKFYTTVFQMIPVCCMKPEPRTIADELLGVRDVEILTTKLVTPYGKKQGQGDMLELVKVKSGGVWNVPTLPQNHPISMIGMGHVAFGVDDVYTTVGEIGKMGGIQKTNIMSASNKSLVCFCRDPEGNWIEVIQQYKKEEVETCRTKCCDIEGKY